MLLQGDFVTTDGSEYALKEALFTKGPMTVSVDAAPDSFVFYSSGIYNNPACRSDYKGNSFWLELLAGRSLGCCSDWCSEGCSVAVLCMKGQLCA